MKKGRFSLILALIILVLGVAATTVGVISGLGILPSPLKEFALTLSSLVSVRGGEGGLWEAGVFLLVLSAVILVFRQRKPFSMFLAFYLFPFYLTLISAYRVYCSIPLPSYFPERIGSTHPGLLFVLLTLEALLALVLLSAVKGLDEKWRRKRELNIRMLEKEGVLKSKESLEEEKLLKRQRKLNEVEEKQRAREEAKYEKERAKAEKAEREAQKRQEERDRRKYEKEREREEERKEKEDRKNRKKELKEKDKLLEATEAQKEKAEEAESKAARKAKALEDKARKEEEKRAQREKDENIGPAPEYASGIGNPNTPLVFPDFDPMPELKNIISHSEDERNEVLPDSNVKKIENSSIMDSLKAELDRTDSEEYEEIKVPQKKNDRFLSGGMLEATLESAMKESQETVSQPRRPIIGFEYLDEGGKDTSSPEEPQTPPSTPSAEKGGFAPSTLSPSHPRYRYFEALNSGKPMVEEEKKSEEKSSSFAPSNLSPDHPRYKYFQELNRDRSEDRTEERENKDAEDNYPSYLSKDHPRRKLFDALSSSTSPLEGGVSYIPQRPFVPENEEKMDTHYEDISPVEVPERKKEEEKKETEPVSDSSSSSVPDSKAKILESINASVREENMRILREEKEKMEESEIEPSYTSPAKSVTATKAVEENEDGTKTITVKSMEEQEMDFNLAVGVGDLASNVLGYRAIENRQNAIYTPPAPDLLKDYPGISQEIDEYTLSQGKIIVQTLAEQRIVVELSNIIKGPTVTMYELKLAQGMIISKIKAREDELNYALGGKKIRILAPVPGKQAVGIEVPNVRTSIVGFKDMIYSLRANENYTKMNIPMILGKTITGEPIVIDVAKMPHMIIAGTTGSGKSVCINSLINTIIYQKSPKDVRLIMVDPKVVELTVYDGIPHLLTPVITEPKRAIKALEWLVSEMERRYSMLARYGVRNINGLNEKIRSGEVKGVEKVPYILLVMDEFADIIAVVGKEMDIAIGRIAAKARAAGIHMILATQRPSADVITGTLKSNLPGRIAFAVSSGINSRVILDEMGAENLLGKGDMLLLDPSAMGTKRIQGSFMSDGEVDKVASFTRNNNPLPDHLEESIFEEEEEYDDSDSDDEDFDNGDGDLYEMAKKIVFERHSASASYLQRRLKIGYNRAARIVEMMEEDGIVGPANGSKPREVIRYE